MDAPSPLPEPERLNAARDVLLALSRHAGPWPTNNAALAELVQLASRVLTRARKQQRTDDRLRDAALREETGIRSGHQPSALAALARPHTCYVCKQRFARLHHFYDSLCPECATLNFARRQASADLSGRVALVTGGRIKVGYHVVLKLLRAGAEVIATTRFPKDAARRFALEPDAETWSHRLRLVGLDLRVFPAIERFANDLRSTLPRLDVFIANAAQTVRRPPAYYRSLVEAERQPLAALPQHAREMLATEIHEPALAALTGDAGWHAQLALLPMLPGDDTGGDHFPLGLLDRDGEPLDLREENSWGLPQEQVSTVELVEVHAINCLAPFLLLRELRPLFRAGSAGDRFAVMVSAVEGQFASGKSGRHPHTNMAKAALNMMVRTSAPELAGDRVFLTAVDPGWFSVQAAAPAVEQFEAAGGRIPLDAIDAAARILDPVFTGIETGQPASGVLFKDYRVVPW
jgi:NAD(P)-dependent dehydrogenase (short-subunit alcohol dehydrogenase family)